jgi:glycosyltransferase involved in cell wall biosynthesis
MASFDVSRSDLLSVGRFEPWKGFEEIILAFSRARDVVPGRLFLLGDGSLTSKLVDMAVRQGLASRVMFPGWVDDPRVFYPQAGAFVFASHFEGLPNAILEAMAGGAAIISTDCTAWIHTFAGQSAMEMTPVGDVEAMVAAIRRVFGNPAHGTSLRKAAQTLSEDFRAEKVIRERDSLLLETAREHAMRACL